MECLIKLVGLKGGCDEIASEASMFLNSKITYNELTKYIDQNDYPSVDEMFTEKRIDAVDLFLAEFQNEMQGNYLARTVIDSGRVGDYSNGLVSSPAATLLKGLSFERCTDEPMLGYRVSRLSFIGAYTGNVDVTYYDGITGQSLATDTIVAVSGQESFLEVNRLFNVQKLEIVYDATGIDGYVTRTNYLGGCATCHNYRISKHVTARGITAPIATPLTKTYISDMGGLMVDLAMVCDNTTWLCNIKQYLSIPIMFKIAELIMEYAIMSSSRGNTNTMRDKDTLIQRHGMYKSEYEKHLKLALDRVVLPNDPICFKCESKSGIYNAIP